MNGQFDECLGERKLVRVKVEPDIVKKEFSSAVFDLKRAESSFSDLDFKWATVQAYYAMFHVAKALVLSRGYMEKSHHCLVVALEAIFVDVGSLDMRHLNNFRDCMNMREDADYGHVYSEGSARIVIGWAKDFLKSAEKLL